MDPSFRKGLKYLALIARGIGFFPLIIVMSYVYQKHYVSDLFIIHLIGTIVVVVMGYMQVSVQLILQEKLGEGSRLAKLMTGVCYVIEFGLILIGCKNGLEADALMCFFTAVIYLALFLLSIGAYEQHYTNVLSIEWIIGVSAIYVLAMFLCGYSILGLMYIAIIGSYLFLNNQYKLEELLHSTKENTPMFKRIRRDNVKWVSLVIGVIFVLYPLRKQIMAGIEWLGAKLWWILSVIGKFILMLLSLFDSEEAPVESVGAEVGVGGMPPAETNPWLDALFWLCVISVTLYVGIRYRNQMIQGLKYKLKQLKEVLRKLHQFLFKKASKIVVETGEYEDTIEDLSEAIIEETKKQGLTSQRKWARQVRKYIKQPSQDVQYREGYRLLIQGIALRGVAIKKDTTPREILQLVKDKNLLPPMTKETICYEKVRYSHQIAKVEEVDELKQVLKTLMNS